ncbi:MAG TPA: hypothetical protein VGK78_15655 [Nocardioides sp.]|uniref:hypothetical protein n=1 Tax=Nocardioides sp. TaxID=35761 RepID=UPI002F42D8EF
MPRDLTDLMERATSFAPPEPHAASDITRLAARRQQRRTTSLAAGLAVAVLAAGAIGYGTTRSGHQAPEPVGTPHDLHQSVVDAVPASSVAGFSTLDYGVPSVANHLGPLAPIGQYADVDASGRLVVMKVTSSSGSTTELSATYEMVGGPGEAPAGVLAPRSVSPSNIWQPSFTGDGGLAWEQPNAGTLDYLLTDAQGQHPITVSNDLSGVSGQTPGGVHPVRSIWYEDGRVWFSVVTRQNAATASSPRQWVSLYSVDPEDPSVLRAEKPADAAEIAVGGGEAVWTDGTTVKAVDLSTGVERTVPMPLDSGCGLPNPSLLVDGNLTGAVTTNGHLISLLEACPGSSHLVVTDLDGRLVTDITSTSPGYLQQIRLSGDLLTFEGDASDGSISPYVDDLSTGQLVRLGSSRERMVGDTRANGRYVIWYDAQGGHVGRFSG